MWNFFVMRWKYWSNKSSRHEINFPEHKKNFSRKKMFKYRRWELNDKEGSLWLRQQFCFKSKSFPHNYTFFWREYLFVLLIECVPLWIALNILNFFHHFAQKTFVEASTGVPQMNQIAICQVLSVGSNDGWETRFDCTLKLFTFIRSLLFTGYS